MTDYLTADAAGDLRKTPLANYEEEALLTTKDTVKAALEKGHAALRSTQAEPLFPAQCFIPNKSELGRRAGDRIGYLDRGGSVVVQEFSRAYDRLGDEIDRRILATKSGLSAGTSVT